MTEKRLPFRDPALRARDLVDVGDLVEAAPHLVMGERRRVGVAGVLVLHQVLGVRLAAGHVLNKLSNDSEIIVMNAAGMSPWILFRAFLSQIG